MKKGFSFILALFLLASCTTKLARKTAPEAIPQKTPAQIWSTAYIIKDHVALHKAPRRNSAIITHLADGDQVRILANQKGWYHILTDNNQKGWIRSNLAGPRNLSRTAMAAAFNDSVMTHFAAQLYVDKNHPYKVIYLETKIRDLAKAKKLARTIGRAYQKKVYPGKLTINLIRPGHKKYFAQVTLKAIGPAHIPLPVVDYGYLEKIEVKGKTVRLVVRVPANLSKKTLLKLARKISSTYSYPFTESEIFIRPFAAANASQKCLLYYVEDEYGEDYSFGRCSL